MCHGCEQNFLCQIVVPSYLEFNTISTFPQNQSLSFSTKKKKEERDFAGSA